MLRIRIVVALAGALTLGASARAADLLVPEQYPTLQAAADAAVDGDTVVVAPGTYRESVAVNHKAVSFRSSGGAEVTILDGEDVRQLITYTQPDSSQTSDPVVIEGFTLTRGFAGGGAAVYNFRNNVTLRRCVVKANHGSYGGAFYTYYGATTNVEDSVVTDNVADGEGGVAYANVGGTSFTRCLIANNKALGGSGGVTSSGGWCGSARIADSVVLDNYAAGDGGVMWSSYSSMCGSRNFVSGSLLAGNSAGGNGGAIAGGGGLGCSHDVRYSTLVDNRAGGLGGSVHDGGAVTSIRGSILWGNLPAAPSLTLLNAGGGPNDLSTSVVDPDGTPTGFPSDATNVRGDPRFVDAAARDYRLLPGSPAVDLAGAYDPNVFPAMPTVDLAGTPRPQGAAMDAGAYELADTVPPVTTATVAGAAGAGGWYVGPVTVSLAATDDASGVASLLWALDGAPEVAVAGAAADVAVTADGVHDLTFHAVDVAGNAEASRAVQLRIDQVPPVPAAPVLTGTAGANGWWRSAVKVALAASDATSGVASLRTQVGAGAAQVVAGGSATVTVSAQGATTVAWSATDVAGLSAAGAPVAVAVDTVAPAVALTTTPTSVRANNRSQTITWRATATDATSGVAAITVRVTNRAGTVLGTFGATGSISVRPGRGERYTFTATGTDNAGNAATATKVVSAL